MDLVKLIAFLSLCLPLFSNAGLMKKCRYYTALSNGEIQGNPSYFTKKALRQSKACEKARAICEKNAKGRTCVGPFKGKSLNYTFHCRVYEIDEGQEIIPQRFYTRSHQVKGEACDLALKVCLQNKKETNGCSDFHIKNIKDQFVSAKKVEYVFQRVVMTGHPTLKGKLMGAFFQPSIVMAQNGDLLVFAQGRINDDHDHGPKVVIMSRSKDKGYTWSPPKLISDPEGVFHEINSFIDKESGQISVLYQRKPSTGNELIKLTSDDHGETWTHWEESKLPILGVHKRNENGDRWTTVQPIGQAIQLKNGKYENRILLSTVGMWRKNGATKSITSVGAWYSDDNGETWKNSVPINNDLRSGETTLIELNDGQVMMISRRGKDRGQKSFSLSSDGGENWIPLIDIPNLPAPGCFQSLARIPGENDEDKGILLMTTPAHTKRKNGRVYYSFNNGQSWEWKTLEKGQFSYSNIKYLPDGYVYVVYSQGHHGDNGVKMIKFNKDWLLRK